MNYRLYILLITILLLSGCTYQYTKNPVWERWYAQRKEEPSFHIKMDLTECTDCFDAYIDSGYVLVPKDLVPIFGDSLRRDIVITGRFPDDLSDHSSWLYECHTEGFRVKGKLIGHDTTRYSVLPTAPVFYIESWEAITPTDSAE